MSGSFESVQWNECVHRLNSHPKEVLGNVNNSPERRIGPMTSLQAGQRLDLHGRYMVDLHGRYTVDLHGR